MKRTRGNKGRVEGRTTPHKSLADVRKLLGDAPRTRDMLIEHLHKIQDHFGHISNRHIDLAPVMTALALDAGLDGRIAHDPEQTGEVERLPSIWVVMAADKARLANFDPREGQDQRPKRWSALPACTWPAE